MQIQIIWFQVDVDRLLDKVLWRKSFDSNLMKTESLLIFGIIKNANKDETQGKTCFLSRNKTSYQSVLLDDFVLL